MGCKVKGSSPRGALTWTCRAKHCVSVCELVARSTRCNHAFWCNKTDSLHWLRVAAPRDLSSLSHVRVKGAQVSTHRERQWRFVRLRRELPKVITAGC